MKSLIKKSVGISLSILCVFGIMSCQNSADSHEHTFATTWTSDDDYHWHVATCEHTTEISDKAAHIWNSGEVETSSTCTDKGSTKYTCTVCEKTKIVESTALGHKYDDGVITKVASCTEKGEKTYTCSVCGTTKIEEIAATGHTEDAGTITTEPTCTEKGTKTYKCTTCGAEVRTEEIAATGHNYDGIKCTKCGTYSVTISSVATEIVDSKKTDGLKLTLNTLTHTEADGYNTYAINYTLKNEITGSEIGPGIFKVIYKTASGYGYSFQNGMFNNLYYNDTLTRSYSWKLTSDKTFVCIEYIPDSLMSNYIFSSSPTDNLLNFVPAE